LQQRQQQELLRILLAQPHNQEYLRMLQQQQQLPLLQPAPPMQQLQLQQLEPVAAAEAVPAADQDEREVLPMSEEFQAQWEERLRVQQSGMLYEWKAEERRLMSLDPPRFMPLKIWANFEAWYRTRQELLGGGGLPPKDWFDPKETFVVSRDPAKQGHLKKYWPYARENDQPQRPVRAAEGTEQPDSIGIPHQNDAADDDEEIERPRRSVSTPIDPVSMDDEPSSSVSVASLPLCDDPALSAAESTPSEAAANAVSMSYSQQGHFSGQLQMGQQQQLSQPVQHLQQPLSLMHQQPQSQQQDQLEPPQSLSHQEVYQPQDGNLEEEYVEPSSTDP
ncbi:hypothetical protein PMAYCL1PPCAC_05333, partial [Pristionchus mayeri]